MYIYINIFTYKYRYIHTLGNPSSVTKFGLVIVYFVRVVTFYFRVLLGPVSNKCEMI